MKVKVSYTTIVEEVVEIDEKFHRLTESGGWNELSSKERKVLTNEFLKEIVNKTNADYQDSITCAEEDSTGELMYES